MDEEVPWGPDAAAEATAAARHRDAIAGVIADWMAAPYEPDSWQFDNAHDVAGELLDGPLRDLIAERDTLAAQVQAVDRLAEMWDLIPIDHMETRRFARMAADRIRRALGTPTTGGGE